VGVSHHPQPGDGPDPPPPRAYFHGFSQREISERTGTPLGTVKSRTTAALRALRETMSFEENRWSNDE
jgi:hypothetical protein